MAFTSSFVFYSSDSDFATTLLVASNAIEKCQLKKRVLKGSGLPVVGRNNKAAQLDQIHRALHHRSHQAEY